MYTNNNRFIQFQLEKIRKFRDWRKPNKIGRGITFPFYGLLFTVVMIPVLSSVLFQNRMVSASIQKDSNG